MSAERAGVVGRLGKLVGARVVDFAVAFWVWAWVLSRDDGMA